MFSAWGHLVYRFRWAFLLVSAALMVLSVFVSASGGDLKSGGIIQTSESGRAARLIQDELPRSSGTSFTVVFGSRTLIATDAAFKAHLDNEKGKAPLGAVVSACDTITCRCFGEPNDESKGMLAGFGTTYHDTAPQAFVLNPRADKDSPI